MADVDPRAEQASEHLPRHVLERREAGLLAADEVARVDAHALACARCGDALAAVRGAAATFLAANPPAIRAQQLIARVSATRAMPARRWRWAWAALPVAAATAAVLLWLGQGRAPSSPLPSRPDVIAKSGDALVLPVSLRVRRAGGDGTTVVAAADTRFAPGDALQLGVGDATRPHVVVLAIGARGEISEVFRGALAAPGELPVSLRLDDAPGDELLVVIAAASPAPLEATTLRRAAEGAWQRAGGDLAAVDLRLGAASGARVWTQVVRKESSPPRAPGRSSP